MDRGKLLERVYIEPYCTTVLTIVSFSQERLAKKEKKEVGKLLDELKSVKNLMNESANEKKIKDQMKKIKRC